MVAPEAFYERDGDLLVATELTRGPWDPGAQHAGPPAALLGRAIEGLEDAAEFHVGRLSFDILRSVPIAPLRNSTMTCASSGFAASRAPCCIKRWRTEATI